MFDSFTLNQDIQLHSGGIARQGSDGEITDIFLADSDRLAKIPHLKNSRGSDRDNMKKAMLYKVKLEIKLCRIFGS